nr:fimbrial subunit precursor of CS3 [Escherichia coli]
MLKIKYLLIGLSLSAMSSYSLAAAGPTLTKELALNVLSPAALDATWAPQDNLTLSNTGVSNTLVGVLTLSNTSIDTVSIASTSVSDTSKNGTVTFAHETNNSASFATTISTDNANITLDKNAGNTIVKTTNGSQLPTNLPLKFITTEGNEHLVSGNYRANITITSTIK